MQTLATVFVKLDAFVRLTTFEIYLPSTFYETLSLQSVGIDESIPRQLAPSVGIGGSKVLISMASSSSSAASNAMEGGKQIQSGLVDFVPHPPARLHAYANLEEAMEMTFGSFRFLVGKEGSHRFSAPIFSGPLAVEPDSSGSSASTVESGDEEVSPPRIAKPADSGKLADLFGGMTFGSATETDLSQDSDSESFTNFDFTNNANFTASREVFADLYDGVTYPMHNARVLNLASRSKNSTIQDPELDDSANSTYHQICVLTASGREVEEDEESEAFDELGNPYVDPADLTRGT